MARLFLLAAVLCGAALAGCGEDDAPDRVAGTPDPAHAREVERNPYALTCGDLARQPLHPDSQKLVIRAEFALARVPALRQRVKSMTENRAGRSVYWALTELCKGREASFRPGRLAVAAVRRGEYQVPPRPESWAKPEGWNRMRCPAGAPASRSFDAREVVGETEAKAAALAESHGCRIVVVLEDGERFGTTADVDPRRIRAVVEDGVVTGLEGVN